MTILIVMTGLTVIYSATNTRIGVLLNAEAGGIADVRVGYVACRLCGPFVAAFDLIASLRL